MVFHISNVVQRKYERYVQEQKEAKEWEDADLFSPEDKFPYLETLIRFNPSPKIRIVWVESPEFLVTATITDDGASHLLKALPNEYHTAINTHDTGEYRFDGHSGEILRPTPHSLLLCILNMIIFAMLRKFGSQSVTGLIHTVVERPSEEPLISIMQHPAHFVTSNIHDAWFHFMIYHNNVL